MELDWFVYDAGTPVKDIAVLKEMPLRQVLCDFQRERDEAVLRSIKSLETINRKPAAQFWKEMDGKIKELPAAKSETPPAAEAAAAPAPRAKSDLPPAAKAAAKAFEKSSAEARDKLLAEFDTVLDRLSKSKGSTQQRLKLIEVAKEEKKRFENKGLVPWSEPMRPFLAKYLASTRAAEDKVRRVYDSLIDAQLRAKNESMVADLRADLTNLVAVRVVARWRQFNGGKLNRIAVLYSNGRTGATDANGKTVAFDAKYTWSYDKGVLIYRVPGGTDTLHVSPDGTTYDGTYETGRLGKKLKIHGVYLKDD